MKKIILLLVLIMAISVFSEVSGKGRAPIRTVPFTAVHFNDNFWKPRIDTIRCKTIPYAFLRSEKAGYIDNFAIAGGLKKGKYQSMFPFDDAEVYKIIEGASYLLSVKKDASLEAYIDSVITIIASAQEPDGYLFTNRTINNPLHPWVGKERWELDWNVSHETFNAGELYEAAIAYYYATGKRKLLDVAIKNADLVCNTFHENGIVMAPGHEVIEMALVRLYEATGDEKYLKQSRFFLESRGKRKFDKFSEDLRENGKYWQDHLPVREQREAEGHAVRALYLYSGMADIAMYMHDEEYHEAIDSIWSNIVGKKMYITAGLGALPRNEAFGKNFELPNASAYCETCASIANCMFNLRMFRLHGESKYIDVLERSLYNTVLSGISVSGDKFFYPNVLEAGRKGQERSLWFDCSCCPTNLSRFIPAVPGYVYATDKNAIYANLFIGNTSDIDFNGKNVRLIQKTDYPWKGEVDITVDALQTGKFDLKIRIPGWAQNQAVPSDLYRYTEDKQKEVKISINGVPYSFAAEKGYAVLKRRWKKGDKISISIPMEVREVLSHKAVKDNRGAVAVERGPLVYCAEFADNRGEVFNLSLPLDAVFEVRESSDPLKGIYKIKATGKKYDISSDRKNVTESDSYLYLIPYYARAYRGAGEMKVWLPFDGKTIKAGLYDELRLIDEVIIGNEISENKHDLQGCNTRTDRSAGWRDALDGWFSYTMNVDPEKPQELVLTYHSTDGGNRHFGIYIDDQLISKETLRTETYDVLMDRVYTIPRQITSGKNKVTVKIEAFPGNIAGGIFGCKIRTVE